MTTIEIYLSTKKNKQKLFLELIKRYCSSSVNHPPNRIIKEINKYNYYKDKEEESRVVSNIEESIESTIRIINHQLAYNKLIHSKVTL